MLEEKESIKTVAITVVTFVFLIAFSGWGFFLYLNIVIVHFIL